MSERTNEILANELEQALEPWLKIATKGLREDAVARISAEVSSHFEAGVHAEIGGGLIWKKAVDAALASLGSPQAARRRFRRSHLTEMELDYIHKSKRDRLWCGWTYFPLCTYFLSVLFFHFDYFPNWPIAPAIDIIRAATIVAAIAWFRFAWKSRTGSPKSPVHFIITHYEFCTCVSALVLQNLNELYGVLFWGPPSKIEVEYLTRILLITVTALACYLGFRLRTLSRYRRLHRDADCGQQ